MLAPPPKAARSEQKSFPIDQRVLAAAAAFHRTGFIPREGKSRSRVASGSRAHYRKPVTAHETLLLLPRLWLCPEWERCALNWKTFPIIYTFLVYAGRNTRRDCPNEVPNSLERFSSAFFCGVELRDLRQKDFSTPPRQRHVVLEFIKIYPAQICVRVWGLNSFLITCLAENCFRSVLYVACVGEHHHVEKQQKNHRTEWMPQNPVQSWNETTVGGKLFYRHNPTHTHTNTQFFSTRNRAQSTRQGS